MPLLLSMATVNLVGRNTEAPNTELGSFEPDMTPLPPNPVNVTSWCLRVIWMFLSSSPVWIVRAVTLEALAQRGPYRKWAACVCSILLALGSSNWILITSLIWMKFSSVKEISSAFIYLKTTSSVIFSPKDDNRRIVCFDRMTVHIRVVYSSWQFTFLQTTLSNRLR